MVGIGRRLCGFAAWRPAGFLVLLCLLAAAGGGPAGAAGIGNLQGPWPSAAVGHAGVAVTFPSSSPFTLADVGKGPAVDPPTAAMGTLFMPAGASAAHPVPAVVLLHGAAGVRADRELTYGRQLAALGIAALVVDAFGARRDRATGFIDRLLEITEAMVLADAYGGLRYLAARPEIDARRVVLVGFSYGGMASIYAAYAQVAAAYAPDGLRFAGHVSFYGPCIARFEDHRTTGVPVLMMYGGRDEIIDPKECAAVADDLRTGGSQVETIVYATAFHQWDGGPAVPWRASTSVAPCRFGVAPDGVTHDLSSGLAMTGPFTRRAILALCVDRDGYMLGRDDSVRERSNRALGAFLQRAFAR